MGVELDAGSGGATVATDQITSEEYQLIKLGIGGTGAFTYLTGGAGAVGAGVQRVTLASDDPAVTDLAAIEVLLTTIDSVLDAIKIDTEAIETAVEGTLTVGSHAVTNGGTFATQVDGDALTALQLIDNVVHVDDAGFTLGTHSGVMMMGFAGTQSVDANDAGAIAMETDGAIHIHDGGNTITVDGSVTANAGTNLNTSALLTSANFAAAFGTAGSADSQVMSVQGIASMTPLLADVTGQGDVPITLDSEAVVLGAGTAEVGSLLPPDTDVTAHTNYARKYYTSATPTDGIIWSPASGKRWHVHALYFNVSAASTVTFEDDKTGGDDPVLKGEFAANSGAFLVFPDQYPMASGEDAADLTVTSSAGTIYVTAVGYEI